ncbi:MAG: SPOR domain-containing protein [Eubacteriales bacterium]|nr:SPOR domain-containing protein [Eubacteriales bacterium]
MRYSRMQDKKPKRKRKYAGFITVVIILGITAYFVGAGAAGGWLAENVINPVFNNGDTSAAEATGDTTSAAADGISASETETVQSVSLPAASGTQAEDNITAQEISLFALQTGAFSEEGNAKEAAAEIIAKGGAGFVAYDGEYYRVLIAAYTDEGDASDVKSSLADQDVSTSIFNLKSGSLAFKIGAEQSQIDAIKACFDIVPQAVDTLQQIIYDADKGEDVDADIEALCQSVDLVTAEFEAAVSADDGAILCLDTYMKAFCETINNIPLSSDVTEVEFSSQLKYNLIGIVVDYSDFLDELGS